MADGSFLFFYWDSEAVVLFSPVDYEILLAYGVCDVDLFI